MKKVTDTSLFCMKYYEMCGFHFSGVQDKSSFMEWPDLIKMLFRESKIIELDRVDVLAWGAASIGDHEAVGEPY